MSNTSFRSLTGSLIATLIASTVIAITPSSANAYPFDGVEDDYQDLILATPVALHGRVVDEAGVPIVGASLRLIAWGESIANHDEASNSWEGGDFQLQSLERRNALLEVSMDGYYSEVLPVELQVALDEDTVELGDIELVAEQFGRARLSFAGDAMFDRRMFSEGVLNINTLGSDTAAVLQYMQPFMQSDDHTAINLETPVTADRSTPHPTKSFVFAAYPESAAELPDAGVDSVSLGNNHIYDYLEIGVSDTLFHLDAIGLPYYGAGMRPSEAANTVHRTNINGVPISLQGFSNFVGYSYSNDESLQVVTRSNPDKAGALPSFTSELNNFVDGELANGRLPIPVLHGGDEYSLMQSSGSWLDFERLIDRGAPLVIGHHPHVVHGVGTIDPGDGPRFVFGSLGNFVFDQDIFETMRSYLVVVDMIDGGQGPAVERVRLIPFRLDGYAPRPLVGKALANMGRYLSHLSTAEAQETGFGHAVIFAEGGRLVVVADEGEIETTDLVDNRQLTVLGGTTGLVALDPFTDTDALAGLSASAPASCSLGRDLLVVGDFEDPDVDDAYLEGDGWAQSSTRYLQSSETHSGTGAAVLLRRSSNVDITNFYMGRSVEVDGGSAMTITGWRKGNNAGPLTIRVRWYNSAGNQISQSSHPYAAGTFDWSRFDINVTAPANADKVRVYYQMSPPNDGEAELFLDDISFVAWSSTPVAVPVAEPEQQGVAIESPNAWDFVRCSAPNGPLRLTLTHRTYEL